MHGHEESEQVPAFMEMLSDKDKAAYMEIQADLAAPSHRYNRHKRIATFTEMLDTIKSFCIQGNDDDWKRSLVCGIAWLGNDIAINTRQLRVLLGKSKSSINGALAKMGYETIPSKNQDSTALQEAIPFLKGNFAENRQWTVRRKNSLNNLIVESVPQSPISPSIQDASSEPENIIEYAKDSLQTINIEAPELFPSFAMETPFDFAPAELPTFSPDDFTIDFSTENVDFKSFNDDTSYSFYSDLAF